MDRNAKIREIVKNFEMRIAEHIIVIESQGHYVIHIFLEVNNWVTHDYK
jgi:hypothetical protein